jgi:hypothetical protein
MGFYYERPGQTVLTLPNGATLTVKTHLTHGEASEAAARATDVKDGVTVVKPAKFRTCRVAAWLITWTVTDGNGHALDIWNQSIEDVEATLESLTDHGFREIADAVEAHATAVDAAARTPEKKLDAESISISRSAAAGVLTGSGS